MRRKKREFDEVTFQITPMIDMTFLLLVFFMVTTKISKQQIRTDIKLPLASAARVPRDMDNRDILNIDPQGRVWVRDAPHTDTELLAYLKQRFKDFPPLRLYVRADGQTPAKRIKDIMRMAAESGATDVIFATHQK